jgi:hypothetical protein
MEIKEETIRDLGNLGVVAGWSHSRGGLDQGSTVFKYST